MEVVMHRVGALLIWFVQFWWRDGARCGFKITFATEVSFPRTMEVKRLDVRLT